MRIRLRLVQHPGGRVERSVHRDVLDDRHPHVRVRFQAKRQDRHAYEEHGHDTDYLQANQTRTKISHNKLEVAFFSNIYRIIWLGE